MYSHKHISVYVYLLVLKFVYCCLVDYIFLSFFFPSFIAPRQFRSLNNDGQYSLKQKILKLEDLNISL